MEKSAGQARIFDSNERSILNKAMIKPGAAGWHGVPAHQTHIRTCDLEVPRGHATVKCGPLSSETHMSHADGDRQILRSPLLSKCHCQQRTYVSTNSQCTDQTDALQEVDHCPTTNSTHPHGPFHGQLAHASPR